MFRISIISLSPCCYPPSKAATEAPLPSNKPKKTLKEDGWWLRLANLLFLSYPDSGIATDSPPPSNKPEKTLEEDGWWIADDGRVLPEPPLPPNKPEKTAVGRWMGDG